MKDERQELIEKVMELYDELMELRRRKNGELTNDQSGKGQADPQ